MRKEAVAEFLKKANVDWKVVEKLLKKSKLIELEYEGKNITCENFTVSPHKSEICKTEDLVMKKDQTTTLALIFADVRYLSAKEKIMKDCSGKKSKSFISLYPASFISAIKVSLGT